MVIPTAISIRYEGRRVLSLSSLGLLSEQVY
jgi:hypothetical protein